MKHMTKRIHLGERIKEKIKERGLSNAEFARRIGLTPSAALELLKRDDIHVRRLLQISKVLNYDFYYELKKEYLRVINDFDVLVGFNLTKEESAELESKGSIIKGVLIEK